MNEYFGNRMWALTLALKMNRCEVASLEFNKRTQFIFAYLTDKNKNLQNQHLLMKNNP